MRYEIYELQQYHHKLGMLFYQFPEGWEEGPEDLLYFSLLRLKPRIKNPEQTRPDPVIRDEIQ